VRRNLPPRSLTVTLVSAVLAGLVLVPATAGAARTPARSASLVSAKRCAENRSAGPMTFVSPFLYDASAGIIDVIDAKQLGYFAAMCITVNVIIPAPSLSPYELVAAGKGTVTGEGSAADDLLQTANGANLVAVATLGDTSDYALLTRPSITNLKMLDGRLLGYHTVLPVVLSEMLERAGASLSAINQTNDNSYDPTVLFNKNPGYAALQAYQSNEPLSLEAEGYALGTAFREWTPGQFGVQGTFNVQVVNGTFLRQHPGTVADFLRAELHALDWCISQERSCVMTEQRVASAAGYPGTLAHSLAEWRVEAALIRNHTLAGAGIGVETAAEWAPEARAVVSFGLLKQAPSLPALENTSLAAGLYHGTTLSWPGN
jgi:NitT/TauT family transport system substrate-binding protein